MDKTIQITEIMRADHPVKRLCVMFGGDIVENSTIFPSQPYEIDSDVMTQFIEASRIMIDILLKALAYFEFIDVIFEPGNHGRIGAFGQLPKDVNWDKLVYLFVAQSLRHEKRIKFQLTKEDIQRVHIPDPTKKRKRLQSTFNSR